MDNGMSLAIFGEALFDRFEDGQQMAGGAPFNVAWHLRALDNDPLLISRVGEDPSGHKLSHMMRQWGMQEVALQRDAVHPTGEVDISIVEDEPQYNIREGAAWDFIDAAALPPLAQGSLLYHGTLALRNHESRQALRRLTHDQDVSVFLDVNLRAPWWDRATVFACLEGARWGKLNQHEMHALGFRAADMRENMEKLQTQFALEQLIVTLGGEGAMLRCDDGRCFQQPAPRADVRVDSVGAGDAFSAMYIHGLRAGCAPEDALLKAQQFASAILAQRGAVVRSTVFYQPFR